MSLNCCAIRHHYSIAPYVRAIRLATSTTLSNSSSFSRPDRNHCWRPLSRSSFATAAAYRPESLDPTLPPRNIRVPDTSINAGDIGLPSQSSKAGETSGAPSAEANVSECESAAQESRPPPHSAGPTQNHPASTTSSDAKPVRRTKLRPRKAAMTLSEKAVTQLRDLLQQPEPKMIRVGVKNRGCSGLAYHLEYVDKPGTFDESVEQEDVKVLIDSKALFSIIGSEMDWVEDKLSAGFVFRNPNITEQCGCGESFSVS